jgi:Pvc16 N-terminal domain
MIDDLSRTLRAILTQKKLPPELAAAQIVFDHPSQPFNPQHTTVDLFLYDIREDLELRSNVETIERHNGQFTAHRPPLRVACSYLVTAWPVGGTDLPLQEQRLLSQVLKIFSGCSTIHSDFLQGSLRDQTPPLPMVTALQGPQKNLSEFWMALGSHLRPSLTVTATIAMDVYKPEEVAMVSTREIRLKSLVPSG